MEKDWMELSSDEKREVRFKQWLSPGNVNFISPDAERSYKQRIGRFIDVIKLKEPERVPVMSIPGFVPAHYSGYTIKEVMYDSEKLEKAWLKYMNDFELDVLPSPSLIRCGPILDILGSKMYKWAGNGLPDNCAPQYVEGEFLRADEWDAMKNDPSDFHLRTYLPRMYTAAEPFCKLPPIHSIGGFGGGFSVFSDPDVVEAFENFRKAGEMESEWREVINKVDRKGKELGFPPFITLSRGGAPLDTIGAGLRGTTGTIMDMFKQPEKLFQYMEDAIPKAIQGSIAIANMVKLPVMFIPLHRGADGFMSEKQFLTFYWPYLKRVILGLVEEGLVPVLFAEGGYNSRLEIISELPKGKVVWHFDQTNIKRAKEILGEKACIMGNVPTSLLVTGKPEEVKTHCRELIETIGKGGGYILAGGASADEAKAENLDAMLQAAKEYGVYRKES